MIKITNGFNVIEVTNGAFKSIFEAKGYRPFDERSEAVESDENEAENSEVVDLETKPVSKWTKEEIEAFAEVNAIDLSNASSVKEMRAVVKEFLDKAERDAFENEQEDQDDWDE